MYTTGPQTVLAQDSRGISAPALQQFYKSQTKMDVGKNRNNIPKYNPAVNAYVGISSPRTSFPLAIPLPFRLEEGERKDTLHKSKTKKAQKLTEDQKAYQKAQSWRYKLVSGTDKHLKEMFIGKCWIYQKIFTSQKNVDCTKLWEAFLRGFAYKEPCDVALEDYKDFFDMIHEDPLVNKVRLTCFERNGIKLFMI